MYNCSPYFDETVSSVIAQTYDNWEAVCIDDCSSDGTYEKASGYAAKDARIAALDADIADKAAQIVSLTDSGAGLPRCICI